MQVHTNKKPRLNQIKRDIKISKPKNIKKPQTYAEKAAFLRGPMRVSNAALGTRNKQKFTPEIKRKITLLFDGKKVISPAKTRKLPDGQILTTQKQYIFHTGGLWAMRDAHRLTIKPGTNRNNLKQYKIVGDIVYIRTVQKGERVRVLKSGVKVRTVGDLEYRSLPLTRAQVIELSNDPGAWSDRMDEKYPDRQWRVEYGSSYSNRFDDARDTANYISNMDVGAQEHVTGVIWIKNIRKKKHVKKIRKTKNRRAGL